MSHYLCDKTQINQENKEHAQKQRHERKERVGRSRRGSGTDVWAGLLRVSVVPFVHV